MELKDKDSQIMISSKRNLLILNGIESGIVQKFIYGF